MRQYLYFNSDGRLRMRSATAIIAPKLLEEIVELSDADMRKLEANAPCVWEDGDVWIGNPPLPPKPPVDVERLKKRLEKASGESDLKDIISELIDAIAVK